MPEQPRKPQKETAPAGVAPPTGTNGSDNHPYYTPDGREPTSAPDHIFTGEYRADDSVAEERIGPTPGGN